MNSDVHHPEPVRASKKRRFLQFEPEEVSASKCFRLSLFPSPVSIQNEPANAFESSRSSSVPPRPKSPNKWTYEDLISDNAFPTKHCGLQSPNFADNIVTWISEINSTPTDHSQNCPPVIDASVSSINKSEYHFAYLATIQEMSQQPLYTGNQGPGSGFFQNGRSGTSHVLYRVFFHNNFVFIDHSSRKIPAQF